MVHGRVGAGIKGVQPPLCVTRVRGISAAAHAEDQQIAGVFNRWMVRHVKEEIPAFVLFSGPRRSRPGPGAGIQILTTVVSPKYFVIDPMITGNLFLLISP